ncbi:hypothetical protein [Paenibacillus sp. HB172176]|uniref:hypothetical protein n=1 Tax=Paenibacillus sp. HB172176 TaxID=2493690 RepID=UPI00143A4CB5|nr:hypothetical protein [Paenibacillus sp. HB172176]
MVKFADEDRQPYQDVSTTESQRNEYIPEEFPEGPYGSDLLSESLGKSSPWRMDQKPTTAFDYENHALHEGIDRDYPGEDHSDSLTPEVQDEP